MKKTRILGIVVLLVAIVAMLSSAVFAANVVEVQVADEVKKGNEVNVTVKFPVPVDGAQYILTYNPDVLEYKGNDIVIEPGKVQIGFMGWDMDKNDFTTRQSLTHTFKAIAEGESRISIEEVEITANQGTPVADVTASADAVKVVAESTVVTPPTSDEEGNSGIGDVVNEGKAQAGNAGDKTITKLKDAKTGFDVMAVVLPMMAIVAVVGVCKFAKRK